jgi:hypothetical protein
MPHRPFPFRGSPIHFSDLRDRVAAELQRGAARYTPDGSMVRNPRSDPPRAVLYKTNRTERLIRKLFQPGGST